MRRRASAAAAFWALALVGCGGDDPDDWTSGRPRIDVVQFLGQSPRAPLGLQFALTFVDDDGDLSGGRLDLSVAGADAGGLALADLFEAQTPPLAGDVTEGELEVLVRLESDPDTNERIRFGFVLEDAAGRRSNEPTVTLEATSTRRGSLTLQPAPGGGG